MNYALDALWWRLHQPQVRALAAVLTAPALWNTHCELPISKLLGKEGFRILLAWNDENRADLPTYHLHQTVGKYAEQLLAFWFKNTPHCQLLAQNVPIFSEYGQTIGSLDFIVQIEQEIYHIELACKYVGSATGVLEEMASLNVHDFLNDKINKLTQQLLLSHTSSAQKALHNLGINAEKIRSVSVIRGMGFTYTGILPKNSIYTANAWTGILTDHLPKHKIYYPLHKQDYLAPVCVRENQLPKKIIKNQGLWAELNKREDGFYHEIQRFMLKID